MKNSINRFEIPDMDKAVPFYEKTLGVTLKREVFGCIPHATFPVENMATAVISAPHLTPGVGVVVYLEAPDGVQACLTRAKAAGAKEVRPHMSIGDNGWIAVFPDPEGNHVGLHSMTRA